MYRVNTRAEHELDVGATRGGPRAARGAHGGFFWPMDDALGARLASAATARAAAAVRRLLAVGAARASCGGGASSCSGRDLLVLDWYTLLALASKHLA